MGWYGWVGAVVVDDNANVCVAANNESEAPARAVEQLIWIQILYSGSSASRPSVGFSTNPTCGIRKWNLRRLWYVGNASIMTFGHDLNRIEVHD